MNGKEVRALKDEEIKVELQRTRAKLYHLRSQTVTEKVENTAQFKSVRRDIARLLTERNSRRHAASPKAAPSKPAAAPAPAKKAPAKRSTKKAPAKA